MKFNNSEFMDITGNVNKNPKRANGVNYKNSPKRTTEPIKLDLKLVELLIGYVFCFNDDMSPKALTYLDDIMRNADLGTENEPMAAQKQIIKTAIQGRITANINNTTTLIYYCSNNFKKSELISGVLNNIREYMEPMTPPTIKYVEHVIHLIYSHMSVVMKIERFYKVYYPKLVMTDEASEKLPEVMEDVINFATDICNSARVACINNSFLNSDYVSLVNDTVDNLGKLSNDIHKNIHATNRFLRTGITQLNTLFGGGFYNGRLYTFLATSGGWKSGILLKCARDMAIYNTVQTKKPGAIPTIVLFTMENTMQETLERLITMCLEVGADTNISRLSVDEIKTILTTLGSIKLRGPGSTDIVFKYVTNQTATVTDLKAYVDRLKTENREPVAIVVDYIKRLKPSSSLSKYSDERERLGHISNELAELAIAEDIPVITAQQINRAGAADLSKYKEMNTNKNTMPMGVVGNEVVANAWDIIENSSVVCVINKEYTENGFPYLAFSRTKIRYMAPPARYFSHPFVPNNEMKLIDDIDLAGNKTFSMKKPIIDSDMIKILDTMKDMGYNVGEFVEPDNLDEVRKLYPLAQSEKQMTVDADTNLAVPKKKYTLDAAKKLQDNLKKGIYPPEYPNDDEAKTLELEELDKSIEKKRAKKAKDAEKQKQDYPGKAMYDDRPFEDMYNEDGTIKQEYLDKYGKQKTEE